MANLTVHRTIIKEALRFIDYSIVMSQKLIREGCGQQTISKTFKVSSLVQQGNRMIVYTLNFVNVKYSYGRIAVELYETGKGECYVKQWGAQNISATVVGGIFSGTNLCVNEVVLHLIIDYFLNTQFMDIVAFIFGPSFACALSIFILFIECKWDHPFAHGLYG